MAKLNFQLQFKSSEFQSLDLPVEIRKPNLILVTKTLASKSVDVKPGIYFVSATLPAGQELYTQVEVHETGGTAFLQPKPQEESPHESHERQLFISSVPPAAVTTSVLEPLGVRPLHVSIGLLRGAIRGMLVVYRFLL
jgi:hypothetical protein